RLVLGRALLQAPDRQPARLLARLHVHGVAQPDPFPPVRKARPGARSGDRARRSRAGPLPRHLHLSDERARFRARLPAAVRARDHALVPRHLGRGRAHARAPLEGVEARLPRFPRSRLRQPEVRRAPRHRRLPPSSGAAAGSEDPREPAWLRLQAAVRLEHRGRLLNLEARLQCPICGASLSVRVRRGVRAYEHGLPVVTDFDACPSCGLLAQVPPPSASALAGYYPRDYRPHAAAAGPNGASLMTRLKNIQAALQIRRLGKFLPARNQPILELGCGGGHFLRALERHGYTDLTGIDRTPELQRAFEGTHIRYRALDLDRFLDLGGPYQAIVMNYVIEHFVSPEAVLRVCRDSLRPGGRVLLLTPNSRALSH